MHQEIETRRLQQTGVVALLQRLRRGGRIQLQCQLGALCRQRRGGSRCARESSPDERHNNR